MCGSFPFLSSSGCFSMSHTSLKFPALVRHRRLEVKMYLRERTQSLHFCSAFLSLPKFAIKLPYHVDSHSERCNGPLIIFGCPGPAPIDVEILPAWVYDPDRQQLGLLARPGH